MLIDIVSDIFYFIQTDLLQMILIQAYKLFIAWGIIFYVDMFIYVKEIVYIHYDH